MDTLLNDIQYAIRTLLKAPGYLAVAVFLLALGIGANTAIFSLINASLLHAPSGIGDPRGLIMLGRTAPSGPYASDREFDTLSYPNFEDLREQAKDLEGIAAYSSTAASLSTEAGAEMVNTEIVTGSYFDVLRVTPARGRLLQPNDEDPKAVPVAVIGFGLWQRLGARDDVIGSTIRVGGRPVTIVGIASHDFHGVDATEITSVWVPLPMQSALSMGNFDYLKSPTRRASWLQVVGRIKPGVGFAAVKAEIEAIGRRLAAAYPSENHDTGLTAIAGLGLGPADREQMTRFGEILLGAVGLVLLLACTNVVHLMLARAATRRREVAIRMALGAPASRLLRQFLTESMLISLIGGALGLQLSIWIRDWLLRLSPGGAVPLPAEISIDAGVLWFTFAISVFTGVVFGITPVLFQGSARDVASSLKEGFARTSTSRSRARSTLVVVEVSLSLVLLASSGLLLKTLLRFREVDPGFRSRNLVMLTLFPGMEGYDETRSRQLFDEIQRRLEALPGIQAVTLSRVRPLEPGGWGSSYEAQDLSKEHRSVQFNSVAPNYFDVMGIDILQGRGFSAGDRVGAPLVAVVNAMMARSLWPGQTAVGKRIKLGNDQDWREIVGVARDVKTRTLTDEPSPYLYVPMSQPMPFWRSSAAIGIKTDLPAPQVVAAARNVVHAIDPRLPLYSPRKLAQQFEYSYWRQRMAAWLIGAFAGIALLLAAVGVYGVISHQVAERTHEIGIRMALGARPSEVQRLVLRRGLVLASVGIVFGGAAGMALTRALRSLLFGVSASDPIIFVLAALMLCGVALLASFVPSRWATRVDPMMALRCE